jgi:hypothetical protein
MPPAHPQRDKPQCRRSYDLLIAAKSRGCFTLRRGYRCGGDNILTAGKRPIDA